VASYYPVSPMFWRDPMVRAWLTAGHDRTVILALYLLTCRHRNLEGLYLLPWGWVESELVWEAECVAEQAARLLGEGFIQYDDGPEVVFVRNALKYQQPKSKPQLKGAINALREVPANSLLPALTDVAREFAPELHKEIRKAFRTHSKGSR
jgi:hypothetical protein